MQGNSGLATWMRFSSNWRKWRRSKKTNVAETLHHLANKIPRRGLVILISDLLDDLDKLMLALQHLKHARHQMIVSCRCWIAARWSWRGIGR